MRFRESDAVEINGDLEAKSFTAVKGYQCPRKL